MKRKHNPIPGLADIEAKIAPGDRITAQADAFGSLDRLARLRPVSQRKGPKPKGLWWALGRAWIRWLRENSPEWLDSYNAVYKLLLDDRRILTLGSHDDLVAFSDDFGATMPGEPATDFDYIDWPEVAKRWAGVELSPFSHAYLYDEGASFINSKLGWAYPWDIPSGCIWDFDAIRGVEILHEPKRPRT